MSALTPKKLYQLGYRLVRLKTYEGAAYEQWDYAHNPTDYEVYQADLLWDVVLDCQRQLKEIEPIVGNTIYSAAATISYNSRNHHVPRPKLAHLANNWGLASFSYMPWRRDDRDRYIGHFDFHWESSWMGQEWNRDNQARFKKRAREVFGLEAVQE